MAIPNDRLQNIAFSSLFRYENVSTKGQRTVELGAAPIAIPHGLGYAPYTQLWVEFPALNYVPANTSVYSPYSILWYVDNNNLYIEAYPNNEGTFGSTIRCHYRIYKEPTV